MKNSIIDTIIFDLDGTLLQFSQKAFIDAYFSELGKVFVRLGMDCEQSIKAVWAGTKAMFLNDGGQTNAERFWATFAKYMGTNKSETETIEAACDKFYITEFNSIKSIMTPSDIPKRLINSLKTKGYNTVLATNPLFPACAVATRLSWIGLEMQDFIHVTHYSNCSYCKPNPGFYREVFKKIQKEPEQCIMVGNNPAEDMCAGDLGAETFLLTDCLENETDTDITAFRNGTLAELEEYMVTMPDIKQ
jgi:FMN phosphatase YigB (HAD superfamily)